MFSASKTAGPSGYNIANSLRFRSSASAYLNRTPASAGNQKTWTWSAWVKRGALGTSNFVLFSRYVDASNFAYLRFTSSGSDELRWYEAVSGVVVSQRDTTQVFRDPSSWYHIILAYDTTQANAADRVKVYVNGVQITAFAATVNRSQNADGLINAAAAHQISAINAGTFFDGYLAEVNFIDGLALDPSSFGVVAPATGVWSPKRYSGNYGLNGFYLPFSNGTSTTTLGYDSSGNGNNWTTNNISLTAGSTYDWMIDSPTKFPGSSYGVGNYCVLMPFTVCNAVSAGWGTSSASDGNLNYSSVGSVSNSWSSFALPLSGKYYAEMRFSSLTTGSTGVLAYDGNANRSVIFYQNGAVYNNNGLSQSLTAWSSGDTIGLAINMDASTIQFYRNGSAVGTAESITVAYGKYFIFNRYQAYLEANFGQRPFAYTPPSGYKSLCTQNLPGVTIQNGAGYMAATLYTGNGATQSISNAVNGVSFQPDFVWTKTRSTVQNHAVYDVVRGTQQRLLPNLTNAEDTVPGVTSFNSSGFSVGANIASNESGSSFVAWQWKAGGTAVTNTAGSITSSVSANTTSGFSVVTYTGTGSSGTIGHGLGVAPSMVIIKARSLAGENWIVGHTSLPSAFSSQLNLNSTAAYAASTNFNSTNPTASVFSIGSGTAVNSNTNTYVAYCFAAIPGYSAFGSYTGNGSSNGPFVYCGFRPRFVLFKRTDSTGTWFMFDTSRGAYNIMGPELYANLSDAESTASRLDFLSNGFKMRAANAGDNASGGTYIYAAFAENPFQNALAR